MSAPAMARACTGRACMRLEYTERQNKFREEIRGWLATHVPKQPLTSFDTEAGFAAHRDWEAKLFEGRWRAVNWPKQYGGRSDEWRGGEACVSTCRYRWSRYL